MDSAIEPEAAAGHGTEVLGAADVGRALTRIAHEILERNKGAQDLVLLGIPTRGVPLARRLAERIAEVEPGTTPAAGWGPRRHHVPRRPAATAHPVASAHTELPPSAAASTTAWSCWSTTSCSPGARSAPRSTRSIDLGRPRAVQLAVLVDRGHRELPIRADYVGKNLPTALGEQVRVRLVETDGKRRPCRIEGRPTSMRHLLVQPTWTVPTAIELLDTAARMAETQEREIKKLPTLRGRTVVNLFFEDSTRTRISFETAAKRLSADVINFSAKGSSVSKGESLKDTALTLQAMGADAVVIRHQASGAPHRLAHAGWLRASVINAGDGTHEHPTQALLDAFTHAPTPQGRSREPRRGRAATCPG